MSLTFFSKNFFRFVLVVILLVSLGLISFSASNIRDDKSKAATTNVFNALSSSGHLEWRGTSFPTDPGAPCTKYSDFYVGTNWDSFYHNYGSMRTYLAFPTESLPDNAVITSATLIIRKTNYHLNQSYNVHIRDFNWGTTLTCGADYGGDPPTASMVIALPGGLIAPYGYQDVELPISNLASIKKTDNTRYMMTTTIEENDTNTGTSSNLWSFQNPRLRVVYDIPSSTPPPSSPPPSSSPSPSKPKPSGGR